jgi:hypothetical protein
MTNLRLLTSFAMALTATAAVAREARPLLPDYAKTVSELVSVQPTGGAGGSGNAKVQVVTILGNAAKPGPYAQLLKVGANAQIAAHHHTTRVIVSEPCLREPGSSVMAPNSTTRS